MKNRFLTISVLKFLYHCARKNKKTKPITYGGRMSEEKWQLALTQCKDNNIKLPPQ